MQPNVNVIKFNINYIYRYSIKPLLLIITFHRAIMRTVIFHDHCFQFENKALIIFQIKPNKFRQYNVSKGFQL